MSTINREALPAADRRAGSVDTPEFRKLLADLLDAAEFSDESYTTPRDALIAYIDSRAQPVAAGELPTEPKLCDYGNQDDFDEAHDDWERQQRYAVIGAMEYNGNTVSYMYRKARNYGQALIDCCNELGGTGHVLDRIKALKVKCADSRPAGGVTDIDELIERLALTHIAPMWGRLGPEGDYRQTEQFARQKAFSLDLLVASTHAGNVSSGASSDASAVQAAPVQMAKEAARWRFMMAVADNADGPEADVMEKLGNEVLESHRPESEQMAEIVDAAIAMLAAAPAPTTKGADQ